MAIAPNIAPTATIPRPADLASSGGLERGQLRPPMSGTSASSGTRTTSGTSEAACPTGSALTGGGYFTAGTGANEVVPTYDGPYGSAWFAILERIPSGTNTWSVSAFAQCAKP